MHTTVHPSTAAGSARSRSPPLRAPLLGPVETKVGRGSAARQKKQRRKEHEVDDGWRRSSARRAARHAGGRRGGGGGDHRCRHAVFFLAAYPVRLGNGPPPERRAALQAGERPATGQQARGRGPGPTGFRLRKEWTRSRPSGWDCSETSAGPNQSVACLPSRHEPGPRAFLSAWRVDARHAQRSVCDAEFWDARPGLCWAELSCTAVCECAAVSCQHGGNSYGAFRPKPPPSRSLCYT
eukprot:349688-Chlamydomonas_euryale.AAC.5